MAAEKTGYDSQDTILGLSSIFTGRIGHNPYEWQLDVTEAILGSDSIVIAGTGSGRQFSVSYFYLLNILPASCTTNCDYVWMVRPIEWKLVQLMILWNPSNLMPLLLVTPKTPTKCLNDCTSEGTNCTRNLGGQLGVILPFQWSECFSPRCSAWTGFRSWSIYRHCQSSGHFAPPHWCHPPWDPGGEDDATLFWPAHTKLLRIQWELRQAFNT